MSVITLLERIATTIVLDPQPSDLTRSHMEVGKHIAYAVLRDPVVAAAPLAAAHALAAAANTIICSALVDTSVYPELRQETDLDGAGLRVSTDELTPESFTTLLLGHGLLFAGGYLSLHDSEGGDRS